MPGLAERSHTRKTSHTETQANRTERDKSAVTGNPTVVSKLLDVTSLRGDQVQAIVAANNDGAKWLRIARTNPNGRVTWIDLPLRLAGAIGLALVQYSDRAALDRDNQRAEVGK